MSSKPEDMISRDAVSLMGELLGASMAENQSITDQLLAIKDDQVKGWAAAYADLYDLLNQEEYMSRRMSRVLAQGAWMRSEASSIINPGSM